HRVRGEDLLVQERLQPALLLLLGAVRGQHLHVPGVGSCASEHLRRRRVTSEDLVQEPELQLPVAGTAELLVQEQRPQALPLDLVLQALHQRPDLRLLGPDRVGEHEVEGLHLLAAELVHPVELPLKLGFGRKVPGHGVSFRRRFDPTTAWTPSKSQPIDVTGGLPSPHPPPKSITSKLSGSAFTAVTLGPEGGSIRPPSSARSNCAASMRCVRTKCSKTYGMPSDPSGEGPVMTWKWRCGAEVLPLLPRSPICCPACTRSPTRTATEPVTRCA